MLALLVSLAFGADTYVEIRPEVGVGWGSYGGIAWRLGGSLCAEYRVMPALGLIADAGGWTRSLGSTLAPPMSQDVLRARVGVRGYFTERPSAGFVDLDLGVASRRWLTDREVANVDLVPVVTPYVGFRLVSRGRQRSFSID